MTGYAPVLFSATYAPWMAEPVFLDAYRQVAMHTMVDPPRCYELWSVLPQTPTGAVLQVGAWRGGSGVLLAMRVPESPVYLADTFTGLVKRSDRDNGCDWGNGSFAEGSADQVESLALACDCRNITILEGVFPEETVGGLPEDVQFRFVHIDVDFYQSAKDTFEWVWPRVMQGGVVVFDDYGFVECQGVRAFVDELRGEKDRLVLHNLNGHAIVVKVS